MDNRLARANPVDLGLLSLALKDSDPENILQPIQMETISIGKGVVEGILNIIGAIAKGQKVLMVTDNTPIFRGKESLKEKVFFSLTENYSVRWLVLHGDEKTGDIRADETNSEKIQAAIQDADCVVGVGGGTVTDLCKHAVHESGKGLPLIIVQTMLSVNAFSDGVSVMLKHGVKRTISSMYPTALVIDLDVVCQAPFERTLAGYGDLMATWTAPADWFLSHEIGMNSNYHSSPYEILCTQNYELLESSNKLKEKDAKTFEVLAKVLTLSGLAMGIAGESSPASGTEHIITHLIDMSAESHDRAVAFHGAQVGVSSLIAAIAWDIFLNEFDPAEIVFDACFPSFEKMKQMVFEAFSGIDSSGDTSKECWSDYEKKLTKWHNNKDNFSRFLSNWDTFKKSVSEMILSPEYLSKCMHDAGAPTHFSQMTPPIDSAIAYWAITNCHLFRNRFTLSDLLFYIGWWNDDFLNRVLERAKKMDSGL